MKALLQFLVFLWASFAEGKIFKVTGIRPWLDYTTKQPLGWQVDTVIAQDLTPYKSKDGKTISNLYEKVSFKVRSSTQPSVSIGDCVEPVDAECTVYGEYRNLLSVKCSDIRVVAPAGKDKA